MRELRLGVRGIHDHLALPLLPLVQDLGLRGLPFDLGVRQSLVLGLTARIYALDATLATAGLSNPSSNKVLERELLGLGVPLSKRTASGNQYTVDLDVLGRIDHHYNASHTPKFPFIPALLERKRLEKARANLESLRPCNDGRLRTALRSTGTETGRYSSAGLRWCSVCKAANHGTNLQNIAKNNPELGVNVKDCFVAPPGYMLWEIDMSMLELRIMAYMAGVSKLIARIETPGCKIHKEHTLEWFDGKFDDNLYTLSKNGFYGMQYGGSEGALQIAFAKKGVYIEQSFIQKFMLKVFNTYPEMALWQQRTAKQIEVWQKVNEPVIARNAYGGCRVLLGRDPLKEFLSTQIQGTAAYTMSLTLLRLARQGWDAPIIGQIHDSYLGMSREEDLERDVYRVQSEMERPCWIADRFVVLPAEVKVGRTWSQLKKVESL